MAIVKSEMQKLFSLLNSLDKRTERNFDSKKTVNDSARLIASLIKKRTRAGRDADNKTFAPYEREVDVVSRVDLNSSGKMLDAIEERLPGDKQAVMSIYDTVQRRKVVIRQLGLGGMPQRKFFDVSERDTQTLSAVRKIFS